MMAEILPDELWQSIKQEIPEYKPSPRGGRPRASDEDCMRGILFVLKTGMQWNMLPSDAFGVSGVTCWRRMREWAKEGVFARIWHNHLQALAWVQAVDWERALVDADSVPAKKKGMPQAETPQTEAGRAANAI
jgi:transposase